MSVKDQELMEECYYNMLEDGFDESVAQRMCMEKVYSAKGDPEQETAEAAQQTVVLRKALSVSDLEFLPSVKPTGWLKMCKKAQGELLWELGMDIKEFAPQTAVGLHTKFDGRAVNGMYVVCQERVDNEWVNLQVNGLYVASEDARDVARGGMRRCADIIRVMNENKKGY